MHKETINPTTSHENPEIHRSENHLPFQKDKLLQILEVRLENSLKKLEFLMEAVYKVKEELADLENSWGDCLPDLYMNKIGFCKNGANAGKEV